MLSYRKACVDESENTNLLTRKKAVVVSQSNGFRLRILTPPQRSKKRLKQPEDITCLKFVIKIEKNHSSGLYDINLGSNIDTPITQAIEIIPGFRILTKQTFIHGKFSVGLCNPGPSPDYESVKY